MPESALVLRIAGEIQELIRSGTISAGSHLTTQNIADRFGVSRSPARQAMEMLAKKGVLEQHENRGFFARSSGGKQKPINSALSSELLIGSKEYQKLTSDVLTDRIPNEVTEQFLRDRYQLTKAEVIDLLMRAVREGWAERKPGYGWRFLPVAKTAEAFEQIYRFRMLIEPAAMLEPTFQIDRNVLAEQRRIQEKMLATDIKELPAERLLLNGSIFHEEIIRLSGNPFFHRALIQVNRMRRLLEYRAHFDRRRLQVQCEQHLEILDRLDKGDIAEASFLMRSHLSGALERKSPVIIETRRKPTKVA